MGTVLPPFLQTQFLSQFFLFNVVILIKTPPFSWKRETCLQKMRLPHARFIFFVSLFTLLEASENWVINFPFFAKARASESEPPVKGPRYAHGCNAWLHTWQELNN